MRDSIAALGVGDPAPALAFNLALGVLGAATATFAFGLPAGYRLERPVVLALGVDLILAGTFPEAFSFHWVFGLLLYALPALAIWAFLREFARARRYRLAGFTASVIAVGAVGLAFSLAEIHGGPTAGTAERLIDYVGLLWGGAISTGAVVDRRTFLPAVPLERLA